jgi:hypothetical protein
MSDGPTSIVQNLMESIDSGDIRARQGWQLTLRDGVEGWPGDVRELVSLGGDVFVAGNRWIIVTEELRDDIMLSSAGSIVDPNPVTIIMLDDLPDAVTADPEAMDELHASGWMTATGDAFVIPVHPSSELSE